MAVHGTPIELLNMDFSTYLYAQPDLDNIFDGYDALVATKADTSSLAPVATSGGYSDLTGKPSIPAAQINSDWNAVSGLSQITNKPSLSTVATSGSYTDLSNKPTIPAAPLAMSFNNAPGRSIVTSTGASGFQVSSSRNADVQYSLTMVTTATIAGNASSTIVFEICATNSATASDWVEIDRTTNGQALTLALTLQSVQTIGGKLTGKVPAGYYAKIRSVTSGTVTNTISSSQEVLL